jgi:hypothetical protein
MAFLAEKERRSGSRRTVEGYARMLWPFLAGFRSPAEVTPAHVLAWAHGIGLSGREPSSATVGARIDAPAWLQRAATEIQPAFEAALRALATRIADAGARLDPADLGNWLVLAQLTLLDIDLSGDRRALVNHLNPWPPGWFDKGAAALGHVETHVSRHGRTARFQADLRGPAGGSPRSGICGASRIGPPR